MRPDVGSIIRLTIRSVVVLPQPEGPTSTVIRPCGTVRLSSSTATVPSAYRFVTSANRIMATNLTGGAGNPPRSRFSGLHRRPDADPMRT